MYCTQCGVEIEERDFYCYQCGAATARAPRRTPQPLYRSTMNKKIAGVCGGLAKYAGMDPTVMRILWLILTFGLPPAGVIGYMAAWIIMPPEPLALVAPAPAEPVPANPVA